MDTPENVPVPEPIVAPAAPKPIFRKGTACDFVMTAVLAIRGDFNHKDAVNACKAYSAQNNADVGQVERNARYVVARLLKEGKLAKVRRGRCIVV